MDTSNKYKDLLEIPALLQRKERQPRKRRRKTRNITKQACLPPLPLPEGKRWRQAVTVDLHINDELPRIGSGRRTLLACVGRKWVYLAERGGGMQRIRKKTYDMIRAASERRLNAS